MKLSQAERLRRLLSDGQPHSTPEIMSRVYGGDHLGTARIASRVNDLRNKGLEITSWPDKEKPTVWWYKMDASAAPLATPVERPKPRVEFVMIDGVQHARIVQGLPA